MKKLYCFFWFFLMGVQFVVHAQDDPAFEWAFNTTGTPISGGESNGKEIAVDDFGKVFVLGYFESTADFDFSGNAYSLTSGSGSLFLAKYESNGTLIWAKKIAGTSFPINAIPDSDQSFNLALDSNGDLILSGTFFGTVDFDPGPAVVTVSPNGSSDVFISKFDSNGNFVWVKNMGGAGSSHVRIQSLFLDTNNNIYLGGVFDSQADFNPGPGVNVLNAIQGLDGFFARYDSNGNYVWAKSIAGNGGNDYINSVAVDSGGNVFITGDFEGSCDFNPDAAINSLTSIGGRDTFIAKYSGSGSYLWVKQIGGINSEKGNVLKLDPLGNIYASGRFFDKVDFDPGPGVHMHAAAGSGDIFIAKYTSSGAYLWSKSIGGTGYEEAFSLLLDNNNAIYITGWFFGTSDFDPGSGTSNLTSNGYNDVFWAKYDITGNYIWSKSLGGQNPSPDEHTEGILEKGFSLASGSNGQVYLTGVFYGTADFDPGFGTVNISSPVPYSNAFWMRFDTLGNYLNAVTIGGYGRTDTSQIGVCVEHGSNGDVYSAGYFRGSADFDLGPNQSFLNSPSSFNTFIAKYNNAGGYVWAKSIGGQGLAFLSIMLLDQDDNIYVAGSLSGEIDFDPGPGIAILNGNEGSEITSKLFLAKYDSNGNYIWAKAIGSSGAFNSIALDSHRNILVSGYFIGTGDFDPDTGIANLTSNGYSDAFIAKYDINGHYIWAKRIDNSDQMTTNSVVCDNDGNFYCTGYFNGTTDFDPGIPAVIYDTNNQFYNVFVVKYNSNGDFVWVKVPEGGGFGAGRSIAIDPTGNLIVAGTFGGGSIDLNPGGNNGTLNGQGTANMYFAKYASNGNFIFGKGISGLSDFANVNAVKTDSLGNIYLTGYYSDATDFNPDAQNQAVLIPSTSTSDAFFAKYDGNGNYLWVKSIGGDGNDYGLSLSVKKNKLLLTGNFSGEGDFDATGGITTLNCLNNDNMFLAKYSLCGNLNNTIAVAGNTLTANAVADAYQWIDCNNGGTFVNGATNQSFSPLVAGNYAVIITDNDCQVVSTCHSVLGVDNPGSLNGLVLYPNPTNGDFKIQFPHAFSEITSKITNILGETISVNRFSGEQQVSLSLSQVSEGLYFVEIDYDGYRQDFKVLKK
ncbi:MULTISPECIES: T9SS type A sorting domain-containing protein [Flavobacterium]|uniref:T9SS type A sorting domain-containing protein n=1 Tax=Flavobacterium TaxID=237 RepID=UPI001FCB4C59|nr:MULTISPECIES: T9SS type A sorting domain-containing protein [Flavobacterium]UOK43681.1 SBBP repeat-containing protein [Flavobacterium enshiense]